MTNPYLSKLPTRKSAFSHRGVTLPYFDHPYNFASHNMRSVEVPIIRRYLELARARNPRAAILEFGNVLGHYEARDWPVLDRRELGPMIVNADVMRWEPDAHYDLIVSISTLEHVGFGAYAEMTIDKPLASQVVTRLKSWLASGGGLAATVPTGFNPILDLEISTGLLGIDHAWFMRRLNDANEWEDCTLDEAMKMPFGGRWKWGGGMAVLQVGELEWR